VGDPGRDPVLHPGDADRRLVDRRQDLVEPPRRHVEHPEPLGAMERDERPRLVTREGNRVRSAAPRQVDAGEDRAGTRAEASEDVDPVRVVAGDPDFHAVLADREPARAVAGRRFGQSEAKHRVVVRVDAGDRVVVGVHDPDPASVGGDLDRPALERPRASGGGGRGGEGEEQAGEEEGPRASGRVARGAR
jgi:hypothetical protein